MQADRQSPTVLFATYKDAAHILQISQSMVKKMGRAGAIQVVKFGRAARIPLAELTRIGTKSGDAVPWK